MRAIQRRIRGFFALQAVILLLASVRGVADQSFVDKGVSSARHFSTVAVFAVIGLIFAMAWGTTRKPSAAQKADIGGSNPPSYEICLPSASTNTGSSTGSLGYANRSGLCLFTCHRCCRGIQRGRTSPV